jgi:hypothetical protein
MPRGLDHDLEDLLNKLFGHRFMEKIAHTVHKDPPRLTPPKGECELVWMKSHIEPVPVAWIP